MSQDGPSVASKSMITALQGEVQQEQMRSLTQVAWKRLRRHKLALAGTAVVIGLILVAIFAPLLARADPYAIDTGRARAHPSAEHWLGTDKLGRDVWARLIYASRVSMVVGLGAVAIYCVVGMILGAISGYYGGVTDTIIQRITDTFMSFPSLMVIITVVSLIGPGLQNLIIVIGLLNWTGVCRLVRGRFLSLREVDFVEAARCIGTPDRKIIFGHIMPNVLPQLTVAATFGVASTIILEAGLSFLGLGVKPPMASWGNMLSDAQSMTILARMPWLWLPPGIMIAACVLSINFLGDGLRDALDPKMQL